VGDREKLLARAGVIAGEPPRLMHASFFDLVLMCGALCAGIAVAATCAMGLLVWFAGGDPGDRP
jgi:hypothetical protein